MSNRFSLMNEYLASPAAQFKTKRTNQRVSTAKSCPQVSEAAIGSDEFTLDVLQFFFEERLTVGQLNDGLRDVAADALWRATKGSEAMDLVPRPPGNRPSPLWLVSQAVQIAFRRAQNQCIYEAVRVTVKLALRSDYEFAKIAAGAQSLGVRAFNVNSLTTSDAGVRFIAHFEGFRANLYNDPVGHCTIGYGTLVHRGNCNGTESAEFRSGLTEERARELMRNELRGIESAINSAVTVVLNQQQFDALLSFAYNVGTGAFRNSTLLRRLNANDFAAVPTELRKWVKASGRTLPGLVRRREAECTLFSSGSYSGGQSMPDRGNGAVRPFTAPRGIRNNNPGNIIISRNNDWEGKVSVNQNTDGHFEQFTSYAYGVRALIILLRNYITGGRNTTRKMAEAYAPSNENDTVAYSRFLAGRLSVGENDVVPLNRNNLRLLTQAIGRMENGEECVTDQQFDEAWVLVPERIRSGMQSLPRFMEEVAERPFFDIRTCQPDSAFSTHWLGVEANAVRIANEQFAFWTKPDGSRYPETDPFVTARLQEYWATVGLTISAANLQNSTWQSNNPWSAAFISYIMNRAGAGTSFPYAAAHMRYTHSGKQNAERRNMDNPFWTCDVNNALPEPGDLICRNRGTSHFTYATIQANGTSHCDIVTEVDYTNNRMTVIGGNKSNSVNREVITLTSGGMVNTTVHGEIFAILKMRTEKCETCGTVAVV